MKRSLKVLILAAGFGTRLRPWTLSHPKALVPVGGIPMLERVIRRLKECGFDEIVVNVHHFSEQIIDFLSNNDLNVNILISDESEQILDTGGGLLKAMETFGSENDVWLIHNVDILSDIPLDKILNMHISIGNTISLITSDRMSSRKLIFNEEERLVGWHNISKNEYRPSNFMPVPADHESSFSGIYFVNGSAYKSLKDFSKTINSNVFPIMDYFLTAPALKKIGEIKLEGINLIDIGKPETLKQADDLISK